MKSKGFILVNYMLYFICVIGVTSLLMNIIGNYIKEELKIEQLLLLLMNEDEAYFKAGETVCRDVCLFEEVLSH